MLGIMACIELPSRSLCIVISLGRLTPVPYVVKGVYITVNLVFLLGNSQAREEYDSRSFLNRVWLMHFLAAFSSFSVTDKIDLSPTHKLVPHFFFF